MKLYTVWYSSVNPGEWASYLPTQDPLEAEVQRAEAAKEGRATRIEVKEVKPKKVEELTCSWCGSPICGYDLFRGPICSRNSGHWC